MPDELQSIAIHIRLDIVMPMVNGLELGKEIRGLDREAQIIYATTEPQYALQAYAASPINYLIKSIEKQMLFDTLTLAISKADLAEKQTFAVKTTDSLRVIRLWDIEIFPKDYAADHARHSFRRLGHSNLLLSQR